MTMKHFTLVLALGAIRVAAYAQGAGCADCGHLASWFMGEGGFIGTVADGAEAVTFVASCGNVTVTGEVEVEGAAVAQLFNHRNGLACDRNDGSLEISGLEDGGWFWVTGKTSSAVGNLVANDLFDAKGMALGDTVEVTSAGDGVMMMPGKGAVYLHEASSGRIGILPNILPEPPMAALRKCGFNDRGSVGTDATAAANAANARFTRRTGECEMGDGGTITLATTINSFTGARATVADKSTIVRPSGTGSVVVEIDLWGNGSGHFTTAVDGQALLGQPAAAATQPGRAQRLGGVTWTANLGSGPTGTPFSAGTAAAGITMDNTTTTNAVTFTIAADPAYCSDNANHPVTVSVTGTLNDDGAVAVTPSVARSRTGVAGGTSFTVVCP